ncbi:MAG: NRDE family protein, partial [Candidatus Angelobacter sp.]
MCTISFFHKHNGYVIGMNRDERLARPTALPPRITGAGTMEAVYPRAEEGGTWIAANAQGISFALLNRDAAARHTAKLRSRGEVIPALLETEKLAEAAAQISSMDLRGIHPFRLAGFFPREQAIAQWNWDAEQLQLFHLPWR